MPSSISGLDAIVGSLRGVNDSAKQSKKETLFVAGQHVLGVSNAQAPIETGAMIRTGAVSQDDDGLTAISYNDAEYDGQAVQQHEDMSLNHDDGRNAKFLENSLNSESSTVLQIIQTGMQRGMGL